MSTRFSNYSRQFLGSSSSSEPFQWRLECLHVVSALRRLQWWVNSTLSLLAWCWWLHHPMSLLLHQMEKVSWYWNWALDMKFNNFRLSSTDSIKDFYDYLLNREYAEPLSLDHQMERKAVRSPSLRLRFGRRSDPDVPLIRRVSRWFEGLNLRTTSN